MLIICVTREFYLTLTKLANTINVMDKYIYENACNYIYFNNYLFNNFLKENHLTVEKFCKKYDFDINLLYCFINNKFENILISDLLKLSLLTLITPNELIHW